MIDCLALYKLIIIYKLYIISYKHIYDLVYTISYVKYHTKVYSYVYKYNTIYIMYNLTNRL